MQFWRSDLIAQHTNGWRLPPFPSPSPALSPSSGVEPAMNRVLEHMGDPGQYSLNILPGKFSIHTISVFVSFVPPHLTQLSNQSANSDPSDDSVPLHIGLVSGSLTHIRSVHETTTWTILLSLQNSLRCPYGMAYTYNVMCIYTAFKIQNQIHIHSLHCPFGMAYT